MVSKRQAALPEQARLGSVVEEISELAQLYRTAPVGLCLMDCDLRFVRINDRLAAINGKPASEHIGRTLREVIPDLADQVEASYRRVIATGQPLENIEVRGAAPADPARERCWLVSCYPLEAGDGTIIAVSSVVRDVTDSKAAEQKLHKDEERLRRLLETTQVVPWQADAATLRYTYVGPQALALLGYSVDQWYEPDFWRAHIHPDDREHAIDFCEDASRGGRDHEFEYRMVAADGRSVWVHDIVSVEMVGSEPHTLRGFMIDITVRKHAEQDLARYRDKLEELVKERTAALESSHEELRRSERLASIGTLAAGIAHQINNPLGGILLAAQSAQESADSRVALASALGDIVSNTKRCGQIVRSVLRFARDGAIDKAPADLNAIVRSAAGQLSGPARECGAVIELALADALPPVTLNKTAIEEVIVNVLQNSLDAGGKRIVLRTQSACDSARLTVRDDGRGVASEDQQHVFDPFFSRRQGRGTGLGLSIAHGLVVEHGGSIDLESEPGGGTTVTVELPRAARDDGEGSHR